MITEHELLEIFNLDEDDKDEHKCTLVLFSQSTEAGEVIADLKYGGHKAIGYAWENGAQLILTELTLDEMLWYVNRWSCIRTIENNGLAREQSETL